MARTENQYLVLDDGTVTLTIIQRSGEQHVVVFDSDDLPAVQSRQWHWRQVCESPTKQYGYAATNVPDGKRRQRKLTLAQFLLDLPVGSVCGHHRSGDSLDCRRRNLAAATRSEVSRDIEHPLGTVTGERYIDCVEGRYRVREPRNGGPQQYISYHATLAEAIIARDRWFAGQTT